jgi:hypothetical protein
MKDFSDFVFDLKKKTNGLVKKVEYSDTRLYMPILDKLDKNSRVRDWIIEIVTNIHQLETGR